MSYDTEEVERAIENAERVLRQPSNLSLLKGIKQRTIEDFLKYLKANCTGTVGPELNVILDPIDCQELDALGQRFLGI